MPAINQIVDTVPLQKSGGTGLDIFAASLADGAGKVVDSGGSTIFSWDENGNITANGLPRVLHTNVTPVGNVGAGEDDLMTYTLPANTLANNGDTLEVFCMFVSGIDPGVVRPYFGGTSLTQMNVFADVPYVSYRIKIVRVSSTVIAYDVTGGDNANGFVGLGSSLGSVDFTTTNVIKFTGVGTDDDDVQQAFMQIKYEPAPQ